MHNLQNIALYYIAIGEVNGVKVDAKVDAKVRTKNVNQNRTQYWGISVDTNVVLNHPEIFIPKELGLVPNKDMHTTLLFVGGKASNEYDEHIDKECTMAVVGYGYSDKALALEVGEVLFADTEEPVKSHAVKQHITVALAKGTKAVDSVKTLLGEATMVRKFVEPIILHGKLRRY